MPNILTVSRAFSAMRRLEASEQYKRQKQQRKQKNYPATFGGYASDGSAIASKINGERIRAQLITNGSVGVGDIVEASRPIGSKLGWVDARNR